MGQFESWERPRQEREGKDAISSVSREVADEPPTAIDSRAGDKLFDTTLGVVMAV